MGRALLGIVHHHDFRHLISLVIRQLFFQFLDLLLGSFYLLGIILLNEGLQGPVLLLVEFLKALGQIRFPEGHRGLFSTACPQRLSLGIVSNHPKVFKPLFQPVPPVVDLDLINCFFRPKINFQPGLGFVFGMSDGLFAKFPIGIAVNRPIG